MLDTLTNSGSQVWLCPSCEYEAEAPAKLIDLTAAPTDITQDFPTLGYLKAGTFSDFA